MRQLNIVLVLILSILLLCLPLGKSSRLLLLHDQGEEALLKDKSLFLNSLQRGPVPPSGPSGCTNIPGSGGGACPINEMHFAGGAPPRRGRGRSSTSAYPQLIASFGVATQQKK
ncbi:hypothetical protein ACP275_07G042800 [Erythranthe tilingii]